ncbi:B3 domain-containing transcription factor FUS3-like [Malania oleifera]|uniref:B3 domain-containing transcription factor FUS3-like n=1 Tax=Malania oleifera TaxID=397392 RepID=UPI0025AE9A44|nr:B3 domain-containing transcription factor FUS3-like [Malania oleifera]
MAGVAGKSAAVSVEGEWAAGDSVQMQGSGGGCSQKPIRRRGRPRRNSRSRSTNATSAVDSSGITTEAVQFRPPREINHQMLRFLFHKELKGSDVGVTARIVIPKKAAELHLPPLHSKEGFFLNMDDMDCVQVWSFRFRYWPNNHSRMYVLENTGSFIKAHNLNIGDFIMLYKDEKNEKYVIQAWKTFNPEIYLPCTMINDNLVSLPELDREENYQTNQSNSSSLLSQNYANDSNFAPGAMQMNDAPTEACTSTSYLHHNYPILCDFPMQLACESLPDFPKLDEFPPLDFSIDFDLDFP